MKILSVPAFIVAALLAIGSAASAQVPNVLSYQGRVQANGTNFSGVGHFKFAIVSPGTNTSRGATAVGTVNNGFLVGITVTAGGAGYSVGPAIARPDTPGSGAPATRAVWGGRGPGPPLATAARGRSSSPHRGIRPPPRTLS